ncbi:hypothetical protein O9G_001419 [Rozella allomycis CSF55]|uniref:3'-5' exonuclease domain-containing protein n=1 Tax=Rozella allomycis (strain CSF55) TaxID=988480 RepID=A0A075B579_ROZAC|nr:hypothetical protein O9G_001419 [Rozella allomycis CSF55]|eukprot:EPZ36974.1 hypothetical protein O9G_001419 [Rozella allomycis CSF55]
MHDCRKDSDALFHQFNVKLRNVFDTQLADAWIYKSSFNVLPRHVSGYKKVLQKYLGVDVSKIKEEGISKFEMNYAIWMERPIESQLLEYAAVDVKYLIPLYERMLTLSTFTRAFKRGCFRYVDSERKIPFKKKNDNDILLSSMQKLSIIEDSTIKKRKGYELVSTIFK